MKKFLISLTAVLALFIVLSWSLARRPAHSPPVDDNIAVPVSSPATRTATKPQIIPRKGDPAIRERELQEYVVANPEIAQVAALFVVNGVTNLEATHLAHCSLYNMHVNNQNIEEYRAMIAADLESYKTNNLREMRTQNAVASFNAVQSNYLARIAKQRIEGRERLERETGITNDSFYDRLFSITITNYNPPVFSH